MCVCVYVCDTCDVHVCNRCVICVYVCVCDMCVCVCGVCEWVSGICEG